MRYILLSLTLLLGGCAIANKQQAEADYIKCLQDNPQRVEACESQRLIYNTYKENVRDGLIGMGGHMSPAEPPQSEAPRTWMLQQNGRTYMCNNFGGSVVCN